MNLIWEQRFLDLANNISTWSKDRSTKVGAVIITENKEPVSFGYNGFPPGVDETDDTRHERPAKYLYTTHAELNAILQADRKQLVNSTIFVTHFPCADCARAIIKSGITKVVYDNNNGPNGSLGERFKDSFAATIEMFNEVNIEFKGL